MSIRLGSDYPVLAAYMQSRAPVSVIRGPLGCTSADTEFLTPDGWRRMDAYRPGDRVAQWQENGRIEFVEPQAYICEPCSELIWFRQGNLSMQLSEEHRMPLYNYRGRFGVYLAEDVERHMSRYTVPVNFIPLRGAAPISDDMIRLAVAINADCHHNKRGYQSVFGLRKERKKIRLRALFDRMDIEYTERVSEGRPTETNISFYSPYRGKRYSGWHWWKLSQRQLGVVLDEMSHWDGLFEGLDTRFFSAHKEDADFMQYAVHATGGTATIRKKEWDNPEWAANWCVHVAPRGSTKAARNLRVDVTKVERVPADRKYCFTVPTGFFVARHDDCIFITGNSGKTIGTVQRLLDQMTEQPPNELGERPTSWLAIRNTYPDLMRTTVKDFLSIFEPFGRMKYGGIEPPNWSGRFNLPDGTTVVSEVIFLALDREDAVRKLKGYQITGCWFNELSEIAKPILDMADLRHGRYPSAVSGGVKCSWHGIMGDTNSFSNTHWLFEMAERVQPRGWEFFVQPGGVLDSGKTDDLGRKIWTVNPYAENLKNLPDDYYDRGQEGKEPSWVSCMLANEYGFVQHGVPVHPRYVDSVHCVDSVITPLERYPLVLGIDFGRCPAATIGQYWSHLDLHVIIDELTSEDMSAAIFAPELKRKLDRDYPGFSVQAWGDPSGDAQSQATEDSPIRIIRAAGIPCKPTHTNIAAVRRASLDNPLTRMRVGGGAAFRLSGPKCPQLRNALNGGYHYRQLQISGAEGRIAETPVKNFASHICEAAEYQLCGAGEGHAALRRNQPQMRATGRPLFAESSW